MSITCPFKYNEKYTYCDCPYPKAEINWGGSLISLEQARILHEIELNEAKKELDEVK